MNHYLKTVATQLAFILDFKQSASFITQLAHALIV